MFLVIVNGLVGLCTFAYQQWTVWRQSNAWSDVAKPRDDARE